MDDFLFDSFHYDDDEKEEGEYNEFFEESFSHLSQSSFAPTIENPPIDEWIDLLPNEGDCQTQFTIDTSRDQQWEMAQEEFHHIRSRMPQIIKKDDIGENDLIDHLLGPESKFGVWFRERLELDAEKYLRFMITFSIQAAYRISASSMFNKDGDLKHATKMEFDEYCSIWNTMANLRKVERGNFVPSSRREVCLWQEAESIVNFLCKDILCVGRGEGMISISLDDDKIWAHMSGENLRDTFGLKYRVHTRANRKGPCLHSGISTGLIFPAGVSFEGINDTSTTCFKKILNHLFGDGSGMPNLRHVRIHSDRDYFTPTNVFDYIASCNGHFVGTTKRSIQCWPFTYNQKKRDDDTRTHLDTYGAPTLFVKYVVKHGRAICSSAFRNGSDAISTAVSSLHFGHHWEGIPLYANEKKIYNNNAALFRHVYFTRVNEPVNFYRSQISDREKALIENLKTKVDCITLRQGKLSIFKNINSK